MTGRGPPRSAALGLVLVAVVSGCTDTAPVPAADSTTSASSSTSVAVHAERSDELLVRTPETDEAGLLSGRRGRGRGRVGRRPELGAPGPPRPDHGAVEVEPWADAAAFWHDAWEDETGLFWRASWRDGDRLLQSPPCPRAQAVSWAYRVPAAWRLIRRSSSDEWVELPHP